jgi:hypothetical protein
MTYENGLTSACARAPRGQGDRRGPPHVAAGRVANLKARKQAGLVAERSEGVRRIYSVRRDGLANLRDWLEARA